MSDPFANNQLELACKLGIVDDVVEALDDGADIDCNGGSPIFVAITAGERAVVETLVERGADVAVYLEEAGVFESSELAVKVDALMAMAVTPIVDEEGAGENGSATPEVDPKMVGTIDRMIRRNGFREPFLKKRADQLPAFRDALGGIGAEDCHAVVSEFLDALEAARSGDGPAEDAAAGGDESTDRAPVADDEIFLDAEAERISEWSTRYVSAEEEPPALAREYLKERKKLEGDT